MLKYIIFLTLDGAVLWHKCQPHNMQGFVVTFKLIQMVTFSMLSWHFSKKSHFLFFDLLAHVVKTLFVMVWKSVHMCLQVELVLVRAVNSAVCFYFCHLMQIDLIWKPCTTLPLSDYATCDNNKSGHVYFHIVLLRSMLSCVFSERTS